MASSFFHMSIVPNILNLGCFHPVACVWSGVGGFHKNPITWPNIQVLYTVWCLFKLYTDTIFVKTTCKWFQRKKKHRQKLAYLMPGWRLEASLHPEGPATGQLEQGFPWFSLVPEQIPRCTACFTCNPPNGNIKNFALIYPSWCRIEIRSDGASLETRTYWLTDRWPERDFDLWLWFLIWPFSSWGIYVYIYLESNVPLYIYGNLALQFAGRLDTSTVALQVVRGEP
jgi:hypothetical protein